MSKTKFLILSLVAVGAITFGATWLFDSRSGSIPYSLPPTPQRDPAEIRAACREHVREADRKAAEVISRHSQGFADFIASRKDGAGPVSHDMVSLYGKWRAVKPYILEREILNPAIAVLGGGLPPEENSHKEYVREKFAEHIFSEADLASAMQLAIEGSIRDIESIENELAVALRQEILGRSLAPDEIPVAAEQFREAIKQLTAGAAHDAVRSVGRFFVSETVAQVATQVFMRLGVSAGILATGAANSWWNFGAGVVIGLVVDFIWDQISDPKGTIEREVIGALDHLSAQASTAINAEMNKVVAQRSGLWIQTIEGSVP